MNKYPPIFRFTIYLLFIILVIYGLIAARDFLYPISIAILFSYLLYPVVSFLEKKGVPRILANLSGILLGFAVLFISLYLLYKQLSLLLDDLPALRDQALRNLDSLEQFIYERSGVTTETQNQWLKEQVNNLFTSGSRLLETAFAATAGTLAKVGLLPVYVFFMLYNRNKFLQFLLMVVPQKRHQELILTLREVSHVTKRYMSGIVAVVAILCVLNSIGLLIVGIRYAILLGILSAFMNFIPYFGTLIGGAIPLTFALLVMDNPSYAFWVIVLFIIIQFLENNILTPNIVGGNVDINPFFTILSIVLGAMIWGIPGMIISVPFLSMFRIFCNNVPRLRPYSYLLGTTGTERHSITIDKLKRLWQRYIRKQ
jgi:predicted PurR-regulated permease PerM